jgi:hypothetical protein
MSIARYISKLGSFLNNNGQITASGLDTNAVQVGMKNRIINGAMMISQAAAGASVTQSTGNQFPVDRFIVAGTIASKFTAQQSSTVPAGFKNSVVITSSSAYTVGAAETFVFQQRIEGFNVADLGWGAVGAQTVTVSFWVRSSVTGTFGGSLRNSAADRSYPFSYTINSANTWEQKSVTIAGDTTGTWLSDSGTGINLNFSVGTGATLSGPAGSWAAGNYTSATGAASVVGTSGATFYITGVQLEKGSTATSFDYRPYGTELALCKRYLPIYNSTTANSDPVGTHSLFSATAGVAQFTFDVEPRVPPSGLVVTGTFRATIPGNNTWTVTPTLAGSSLKMATLALAGTGMGTGFGTLLSNSLPAQLQFTGCEL